MQHWARLLTPPQDEGPGWQGMATTAWPAMTHSSSTTMECYRPNPGHCRGGRPRIAGEDHARAWATALGCYFDHCKSHPFAHGRQLLTPAPPQPWHLGDCPNHEALGSSDVRDALSAEPAAGQAAIQGRLPCGESSHQLDHPSDPRPTLQFTFP